MNNQMNEVLAKAFTRIIAEVMANVTTEQLLNELRKRAAHGGSDDKELRALTDSLAASEKQLEKAVEQNQQTKGT